MNLSVRVSSSVLFNPILAATSACTLGSSCSCSALKPSSLLAKAYASLPVRRLVFIGGSTSNLRRASANLLLDINSSFSIPHSCSRVSFASFNRSICSSNLPKSNRRVGSINILNVMFMTRISSLGNPMSMNILNNLCVSSTSLMQ